MVRAGEKSQRYSTGISNTSGRSKGWPRVFPRSRAGPASQPLEHGAQSTHLAGINSVVILVGVSAAALGFMRDSFFPMIHAVLASSPE